MRDNLQAFIPAESVMTVTEERLASLRQLMAQANYDAFVVPRADEYLGEYIPLHNERLRWISGFTGSAGMALVLRNRAAIFVDGRYTVQVRSQVASDLFEYLHLADAPQADWLATVLPAGSSVACDPRLHSLQWYEGYQKYSGRWPAWSLCIDADNLIDRCWLDRPRAGMQSRNTIGRESLPESPVRINVSGLRSNCGARM